MLIKKHIFLLAAKACQSVSFRRVARRVAQSRKLIVFFVPEVAYAGGGVMSIFNMAKTSRQFADIHGAEVILCTLVAGDRSTYFRNRFFKSKEVVYRIQNLMSVIGKLDSLMIHIPEYASHMYFDALTDEDRRGLKSIKNLQINILNQNIEMMPPRSKWQSLLHLTSNISMTVAHHRYANQATRDDHGVPMTLIPAAIDFSMYPNVPFRKKKKLIAYSNDKSDWKENVLSALRKGLPRYDFVEISGMTFDAYMKTISMARYTISFGEGYDGYFIQPPYVGSVGIAVYNDSFFPDRRFLDLPNVFESYSALVDGVARFIGNLDSSPAEYERLSARLCEENNRYYKKSECEEKVRQFYQGAFDFS